MQFAPVLVAGRWRAATAERGFSAENPATGQPLEPQYPVSRWEDCDQALSSAAEAAQVLRSLPAERVALFLDRYASLAGERAADLVAIAHLETALPAKPRLADVELPRTTGQLRQAAAAAREGAWQLPTIDAKNNIRSRYAPLGPVCVMGPNNFPFAFNSAAGGDFAAAIASGNPVIAKANTSHPGTTRLLAELAQRAAGETGLPVGTIQLLYRLEHSDGERLVADRRLGATAYTGSRQAGLKLKAAADAAGKPIYLELSSINPVVILPGALEERLEEIATEFTSSCLMGTGQFCTNPGLVILLAGDKTEEFIARLAAQFSAAPVGTLLSKGVQKSLRESVRKLVEVGAEAVAGGDAKGVGEQTSSSPTPGYRYPNTLLRTSADQFLSRPEEFQTEAFGNASLLVVAESPAQAEAVLTTLEGNLTGSIYSSRAGEDDPLYDRLAPQLRPRVGRLLNDKMPTGVAVSPAMNHGGPYPATGHPGFTAVGIPASLRRFAMLECYDNVRPERLPEILKD